MTRRDFLEMSGAGVALACAPMVPVKVREEPRGLRVGDEVIAISLAEYGIGNVVLRVIQVSLFNGRTNEWTNGGTHGFGLSI